MNTGADPTPVFNFEEQMWMAITRQYQKDMAGPHQTGMKQLIALITGPTDAQHKHQEALRILRNDPPLVDFFLMQQQVAEGITPNDTGVDRSWQQSVTDEERNLLLELIAHTIKAYPSPDPNRFWSGEPLLLETRAFRAAGSRQEYYRLLGQDMRRVIFEREERKLNLQL